MAAIVLLVLAAAVAAQPPRSAPDATKFVAVGAVHAAGADASARQRELEEMRRLRFSVVSIDRGGSAAPRPDLILLDPLVAGAHETPFTPREAPARIAVGEPGRTPATLTLDAWTAIAGGAGAVIFDDWAALRRDPALLAAAAAFADAVTRNAALYAPLRPRDSKSAIRRVDVMTGDAARFEVRLLESSEALVLIGLNHAATASRVTLTFSAEMPEAIWQNMLTGGAVNFVASPAGPTYERTFPPRDVLVLMIRKALR